MTPLNLSSLEGQIFNGTYKITRLIAVGGMGAVYQATHTRLPKKYALKLLHHITKNDDISERFHREAMITSELGHPNIVEVHDFNQFKGIPYIVMEYLEGESLGSLMNRARPSVDEVLDVVKQVGRGLQIAHDYGIVHRDLKPDNIFLVKREPPESPQVKLLDFGISKIKYSKSIVTEDELIMGTIQYMSPEQALGTVREIDQTTDIFALGTIVYQWLSGTLPWEAPTNPGIIAKICVFNHAPITEWVPKLPQEINNVLAKCLAKEKKHRYQSVTKFIADLCAVFETPEASIDRHEVIEAVKEKAEPSATTSSVIEDQDAPTHHYSPMAPTISEVGTKDPPRPEPEPSMNEAITTVALESSTAGSLRWRKLLMIAAGITASVITGALIWFFSKDSRPERSNSVATQATIAAKDLTVRSQSDSNKQDETQNLAVPTLDASVPKRVPDTVPTKRKGSSEVKNQWGTLVVVVKPWAKAKINGKAVEDTPFRKKLRVGTYRIELYNYIANKRTTFTVKIRANRTTSIKRDWRTNQ